MITTQFCTCHDSTAVVACAKLWSDLMSSNRITTIQTFYRIWIMIINSLVQWRPVSYPLPVSHTIKLANHKVVPSVHKYFSTVPLIHRNLFVIVCVRWDPSLIAGIVEKEEHIWKKYVSSISTCGQGIIYINVWPRNNFSLKMSSYRCMNFNFKHKTVS